VSSVSVSGILAWFRSSLRFDFGFTSQPVTQIDRQTDRQRDQQRDRVVVLPYRVSPPVLPLTELDVEDENPLSGKFLKYMPSNFSSGCFIAAITREVRRRCSFTFSDTIDDSRLRPRCAISGHCIYRPMSTKSNSVACMVV